MIEASLQQPFPLSPGTAAQGTKLAGNITDFNRSLAALEAQTAALRSTPPGDWSATDETVAGKLRSQKIDALNAEIDLRGSIETFYAAVVSQDQTAAVNAAIAALDSTRASVADKLVQIGYGSDGGQGLDPLVARHPDVFQASQALDAVRSCEGTLRAQRNDNSTALAHVEKALADIQAKSLAVLSA